MRDTLVVRSAEPNQTQAGLLGSQQRARDEAIEDLDLRRSDRCLRAVLAWMPVRAS